MRFLRPTIEEQSSPLPHNALNLVNLHRSTCYMNAVLQALHACNLHTPVIASSLPALYTSRLAPIQVILHSPRTSGQAVLTTIQALTSLNHVFSAESVPTIQPFTQQDASEFANFVLAPFNSGLTGQLSRFTLDWDYQCSSCGERVADSYLESILAVSIVGASTVQQAVGNHLDSIMSCKCKTCVTLPVQSLRPQQRLVSVGNSLWITLGRHYYDAMGVVHKDPTLLLTSELLSISSVTGVTSLQLQFVLEHIGDSADSGHYVCMFRDAINNWWRCDDSTITKVLLPEVLATQAYMVGYVRPPPAHLTERPEERLYDATLDSTPETVAFASGKDTQRGPPPAQWPTASPTTEVINLTQSTTTSTDSLASSVVCISHRIHTAAESPAPRGCDGPAAPHSGDESELLPPRVLLIQHGHTHPDGCILGKLTVAMDRSSTLLLKIVRLFTIDQTREPHPHPNHCGTKFTNTKQCEIDMTRAFGKLKFSEIHTTHDGTAHDLERWMPAVVANLVPFLARLQWIVPGGSVYLPDEDTVKCLINKNWSVLKQLYQHPCIVGPQNTTLTALPTVARIDGLPRPRRLIKLQRRSVDTKLPWNDYLPFPNVATVVAHHTVLTKHIQTPAAGVSRTTQPSGVRGIANSRTVDVVSAAEITTSSLQYAAAPGVGRQRTSTKIQGSSADGRLSIHVYLEELLSDLSAEELTLLSGAATLDECALLLLTKPSSIYSLKLYLTSADIRGYGAGTPAKGHCALLALDQAKTRHETHTTEGPIAGTYPRALDIRRIDHRQQYQRLLSGLSERSLPEARSALLVIQHHVESSPSNDALPREKWFNGQLFRQMRLDFPLVCWQHEHGTQGTCAITYATCAGTASTSTYSLLQLHAILQEKGHLLFALNHFCPLPDFRHHEELFTSAKDSLVAHIVQAIRGQNPILRSRPVDLITLDHSPDSSQTVGVSSRPVVVPTKAKQTSPPCLPPRLKGVQCITAAFALHDPTAPLLFPPERAGIVSHLLATSVQINTSTC